MKDAPKYMCMVCRCYSARMLRACPGCGHHGAMMTRVLVETPEERAAWLKRNGRD